MNIAWRKQRGPTFFLICQIDVNFSLPQSNAKHWQNATQPYEDYGSKVLPLQFIPSLLNTAEESEVLKKDIGLVVFPDSQ